MIKEPLLSTKNTPTRYGGLLICGTNYALAKGAVAQVEKAFEPWAEYFSHESNSKGDRFVTGLIRWFNWWKIPLENGNGLPNHLNQLISQTNLFYDSSKEFNHRTREEMDLAYRRLQKNLTNLNASGLWIASGKLFDETQRRINLSDARMTNAGKFWLLFGKSGSLRVVISPHPASRQNQKDVEAVGSEMSRWITQILEDQKKKQA